MRSISKTADEAMDQVKDTAASAKGSLLDFGTQALKFINTLRVMEMRGADTVLDRIGLQRRESALRPVFWFAAGGLAVGAVALVLAPATGKDLRARIARLFDAGVDKAKEGVDMAKEGVEKVKEVGKQAEAKVEDALGDAKKAVTHAAAATESRVQQGVDELRRNNVQKNDHLR
jgi:gas vesicle protein